MIRIALVGVARGAAFAATTARFATLLRRAAGTRRIGIYLTAPPGTGLPPEGPPGEARPVAWEALLGAVPIGAAVVAGAEPTAADLVDEASWPGLCALFRWSERGGRPLLLSCLAAHAAARYADGVPRLRLPAKRSDLYECWRCDDDPLLDGVPARSLVPHSRWHSIADHRLAAPYRVLTRARDGDVDSLVRRGPATWLMLQGHPEYGPLTLLHEYRRDVGRFLDGTARAYPDPPRSGLDPELLRRFDAFRAGALAGSAAATLAAFPALEAAGAGAGTGVGAGSGAAAALVGNWLAEIARAVPVAAAGPAPLVAASMR